jgi:hypothetical protein
MEKKKIIVTQRQIELLAENELERMKGGDEEGDEEGDDVRAATLPRCSPTALHQRKSK